MPGFRLRGDAPRLPAHRHSRSERRGDANPAARRPRLYRSTGLVRLAGRRSRVPAGNAGAPGKRSRLRPVLRPAAAHRAGEAGGGRARGGADPAPHRRRRLVPGGADGRSRQRLRRAQPRPRAGTAGAAHPVSGLRALAARLRPARTLGRRSRLLENPAGRPAHAGAAHRQAPAAGARLRRRHRGLRRARRHRGTPAPAGGGRAHHAVLPAAVRLPGAAGAPRAPGRPGHRHLAGRTRTGGNRGADRLLRQYAGDPRPHRPGRQLPPVRPSAIGRHARCRRTRRGALRPAGRRTGASQPRPQPQPAVPGRLHPAQHPGGDADAGRTVADPGAQPGSRPLRP